jgi:hypothetical protein
MSTVDARTHLRSLCSRIHAKFPGLSKTRVRALFLIAAERQLNGPPATRLRLLHTDINVRKRVALHLIHNLRRTSHHRDVTNTTPADVIFSRN